MLSNQKLSSVANILLSKTSDMVSFNSYQFEVSSRHFLMQKASLKESVWKEIPALRLVLTPHEQSARIDFHWMEFFPSVGLENGHASRRKCHQCLE